MPKTPPPTTTQSLFDKAGGEPTIRAVVETFYEAVFGDIMIGFFFAGADRQRLIDKETELASKMLGGPGRYSGKPMREAHAKHRIMGGHFERRLQLLREAMDAHDLPADIREAWVEHTQALRAQVTEHQGSGCD